MQTQGERTGSDKTGQERILLTYLSSNEREGELACM
jgi:hypothetical protein